MRRTPEVALLEAGAEILSSLLPEVMFVGGTVIELLITDPTAPLPRTTNDIDLVVEVASRMEFYKLEEKLRSLGLSQQPGDPVCRWTGHAIKVDIMPADASILGFSNPWFSSALSHSWTAELPNGTCITVIDGPHLAATKLEAYFDRGQEDPFLSHDFEDFVLLVDGRDELRIELEGSPPDVRGYVADSISALMNRSDFLEAVEGALAARQESEERARGVVEKLSAIRR